MCRCVCVCVCVRHEFEHAQTWGDSCHYTSKWVGFRPGHTSFAYFFFRGSIASVSERGGGVVGETLPCSPTGDIWTSQIKDRYQSVVGLGEGGKSGRDGGERKVKGNRWNRGGRIEEGSGRERRNRMRYMCDNYPLRTRTAKGLSVPARNGLKPCWHVVRIHWSFSPRR